MALFNLNEYNALAKQDIASVLLDQYARTTTFPNIDAENHDSTQRTVM